MEIQPRHVLCILHHAALSVREISGRFPWFEYDAEYSVSQPDARMEKAFLASADRVEPSMTDADWQAIQEHTVVSYVLSPRLTPANSLEVSRQALALIAACLEAGALAVKGESSGIAHGRKRWLQLNAKAAESLEASLIRAWVRLPIYSAPVHYCVGMHLLGGTDVEVAHEQLSEPEIVDTIMAFLHFLLIDKPKNLASGHAFRVSADATRFRMFPSQCTRYEPDDFFYNPYGYWRLIPIA